MGGGQLGSGLLHLGQHVVRVAWTPEMLQSPNFSPGLGEGRAGEVFLFF